MANLMSYATAGVPAPAVGTTNDPTFFRAVLDHVFTQHNADDALVAAASATGVGHFGALAKYDGAGGLVATSLGATGQVLGANGVFQAAGTGTAVMALFAPTGQTNSLLIGFLNSVAQFSFGPTGSLTTLGTITAGSGAVALTDAAGKILAAALNTVDVPHGGTGKATGTAGSLAAWNGGAAMAEIAPGTAGNILTSTGTAWTSATGIGGGSFATGAIPFAKIAEGAVTANGTNLTLTVGAMKFNDPNGVAVTYGGGTYTIPGVQVPGTGNNAWVLVYMSANGAVGSVVSAFGPTPSRPSAQPNTETLEYVYLRANTTAIFNADDSVAGHGYLEGGWRNPWAFGAGGGGGGSLATPVAISLGGTGAGDITTARTNLAAAASGVNGDITKLGALTQVNGGLINFASGSMGINTVPVGNAWQEFYQTGFAKQSLGITALVPTTQAGSGGAFSVASQYLATVNEGTNGMLPVNNIVTYGTGAASGTPVAAVGTVNAQANSIYVQNTGGTGGSEHNALFLGVNYQTNNPGNTNTTPGRGWIIDAGMHGAIAQRQNAFGGIHAFLNNYYNGSTKGNATTPVAGTFNVQTLHASGALTAGTFIITWLTLSTTANQWNDSAATINGRLTAAGIPYTASGGPLTTPTDIALTATSIGPSQGAITVTPTGITGGTITVSTTTAGVTGAYYDPTVTIGAGGTDNPSGAFWAVSEPGTGTATDSAHTAAQTFPVDVGVGVVGYSGTTASTYSGATRGYTVGVQIGGRGSNWVVPFSRIGTGLFVTDYDTAGARFYALHPAAAAGTPAIQVDNGAGGIIVGSGGNNTLRSPIFGVVGGALGATAGNKTQLASFGMTTTNTEHLGIYGQRITSGSSSATAAFVLQIDVDASANAGGLLALTPAGVGIGGVAAQNIVNQVNTFSGSLTYPAIGNGTANMQVLTVAGGLTVGDPVSVGITPAMSAGAFAVAQVVNATTVYVTIVNFSGVSYTPGTVTAKVMVLH